MTVLPASQSRLLLWLRATRPQTLLLAATPVLTGSVLGALRVGAFDWPVFAVMMVAALAIQAATNLLNDAEDGLRGHDTAARQGPERITASGWASPAEVRRAALTVFGFAALCGLYLIAVGGWPIALIGILSLVSGAAYSAGPKPLSHTPYSELFVLAFFGIIAVSGADYLMAGSFSFKAALTGQALGLFAAGVLHVNNCRDAEEDERAGRRTLAILAGPGGARLLYGFFILLPFALLALIALSAPVNQGVWLAAAALPLALWLLRHFPKSGDRFSDKETRPDKGIEGGFARAGSGPDFNRLLKLTVLLQFAYGALLCLGAALAV